MIMMDTLPSELLNSIFWFVDPHDLIKCSFVCHLFYNIIRNDFIWTVKYGVNVEDIYEKITFFEKVVHNLAYCKKIILDEISEAYIKDVKSVIYRHEKYYNFVTFNLIKKTRSNYNYTSKKIYTLNDYITFDIKSKLNLHKQECPISLCGKYKLYINNGNIDIYDQNSKLIFSSPKSNYLNNEEYIGLFRSFCVDYPFVAFLKYRQRSFDSYVFVIDMTNSKTIIEKCIRWGEFKIFKNNLFVLTNCIDGSYICIDNLYTRESKQILFTKDEFVQNIKNFDLNENVMIILSNDTLVICDFK